MRSVAAALLALAVALAAPSARAAESAPDEVLLVEGWSAVEIRRIIDDFASLYGLRDFVYDLRPEGPAQRLAFPNDIAPALFAYLLNYLTYPLHLDADRRRVVVVGSAVLAPGSGAPAPLLGQRALFYVPAGDQDYDVVYVRVATQVYATSFESGAWRPIDDARLSAAARKLAARLPAGTPR